MAPLRIRPVDAFVPAWLALAARHGMMASRDGVTLRPPLATTEATGR